MKVDGYGITPEDWNSTPESVRRLLRRFVETAMEIELVRTRAATPKDDPSRTLADAPAVAGSRAARLMILGRDGLSFSVGDSETLIGRRCEGVSEPHIDLSTLDPDTRVSRRHARIFRQEGKFWIEDLGSTNMTFINDIIRLFAFEPRELKNGDKIQIGGVHFRFLFE